MPPHSAPATTSTGSGPRARRCLYVGCAGGRGKPVPLAERLRRAYRDHDWAAEVDSYDWAAFPSAADAAAEERAQIRDLRPVHNQSMRACRAGRHDVTVPGSQTADGKCAKCTRERMAVYLPAWRQQNPAKDAEYQSRYRERLGEDEWSRRIRKYSRDYRERKIYAAGGTPLRVIRENHRTAACEELLRDHRRTNQAVADLTGSGVLVVWSVRLELEAEGLIPATAPSPGLRHAVPVRS